MCSYYTFVKCSMQKLAVDEKGEWGYLSNIKYHRKHSNLQLYFVEEGACIAI